MKRRDYPKPENVSERFEELIWPSRYWPHHPAQLCKEWCPSTTHLLPSTGGRSQQREVVDAAAVASQKQRGLGTGGAMREGGRQRVKPPVVSCISLMDRREKTDSCHPAWPPLPPSHPCPACPNTCASGRSPEGPGRPAGVSLLQAVHEGDARDSRRPDELPPRTQLQQPTGPAAVLRTGPAAQ
uniref:Uncharacterized protein n=1 Tax=Sphaerodactylus townsendi TaxID=933632 RepID=A0ACB8FCU9_9SAUR